MTIGDRRTVRGPRLFRGQHQPRSPLTGQIPAGALRNAYSLSTTGGLFLAQYARPLDLRSGQPSLALTGTITVASARAFLPDHLDSIRCHYVFAADTETELTVEHVLRCNTTGGDANSQNLREASTGFAVDKFVPRFPDSVFEGFAQVDIPPAAKGTDADVDLQVTGSTFPTGRAGYVLLSWIAWAEVRGG